jgi:hypothetical protein
MNHDNLYQSPPIQRVSTVNRNGISDVRNVDTDNSRGMSIMTGFPSLPEPYALSTKKKDALSVRQELRTPPPVKLLDLVEPASSGEGPSRYYTCLGMSCKVPLACDER